MVLLLGELVSVELLIGLLLLRVEMGRHCRLHRDRRHFIHKHVGARGSVRVQLLLLLSLLLHKFLLHRHYLGLSPLHRLFDLEVVIFRELR